MQVMTRPTRHPSIEQLYSEPEPLIELPKNKGGVESERGEGAGGESGRGREGEAEASQRGEGGGKSRMGRDRKIRRGSGRGGGTQ